MTREVWINQCAQRLIGMYGYGLYDAQGMAETLAKQQAERYGDVSQWVPAFAVADECGREKAE